MKYTHLIVLLFCFCLSLGCQSTSDHEAFRRWMAPNGKVKVLCTIAMIEDLVKGVGGEYVDSYTLIRGALDPHTYQLVKGDDEKLRFADLIFFNGLGLEHGPSLRSFLAESEKATSLGDQLLQESPESILFYNGSIDPHIWMDVGLWSRTVSTVVAELERHDPSHAMIFRENGKRLIKEMKDAHEKFIQEMARIPLEKRFLITSHDAFNYFARAYLSNREEIEKGTWQKRFAAPEGLSPESQLSTTDIRLIIDHMKAYHIQVIFPESNVSQASIRKLYDAGQEMGMTLRMAKDPLYGDAMGAPGSSGDTYLKMIEHNVKTIAKYLNHE